MGVLPLIFLFMWKFGLPIGTTEEVCWKTSIKWGVDVLVAGGSIFPRKLKGPLQEPGPWSGTVTHTI